MNSTPLSPLEIINLEGRRSAKVARLRYVTDTTTGIRRVRQGRKFSYLSARGKPLRDAAVLERIRLLAIPPAWQEVWICPWANGHLQAVGLLHEFCLALGRLGGHQNRKRDHAPGWLILWRGWTKLQLLVDGYLAAQSRRCG